ncbi:hypothetical protein PILCRDRAFT_799771 [Piloderma croceum F 1598]|uniref:Uncharacterized protein n=1 Tax=Piloderma croceum (strain F 1598) TaxID=765440 RepID=A0A0C3ERK1_PILCF|nr:hypothetical protein PILCRDRAFT_799771 [Piloderma croceum F 1598]
MHPLANHCTYCKNKHCQCRQPSKDTLAALSNSLNWSQVGVYTIDSAQANERLFAKLATMFARSPHNSEYARSLGINSNFQQPVQTSKAPHVGPAFDEPGIARFLQKESADKWRINETFKLIIIIIDRGAKHGAAVSVHREWLNYSRKKRPTAR